MLKEAVAMRKEAGAQLCVKRSIAAILKEAVA
jgi:hypothetical protein